MEEIEKPYSKLEWLVYIVILPLIFTLVLTGILLHFFGFNVVDKVLVAGNKVPGLAAILPDPKVDQSEESTESELDKASTRLKDAESSLQESEARVEELTQELKQKEAELAQLQDQLKNMELELQEKKASDEERKKKLQDLAKLYAGMSAGKAAPILAELTPLEAAAILEVMNTTQRSAILAKLPPQTAATITVALKEKDLADNPEIAALQERINVLTEEILSLTSGSKTHVSIEELSNTYGQMPPKQAATVLSEMSKVNADFQLAIRILANMNDTNRSRIMAEMSNDIAQKFTKALPKK